MQNIEDTKIQEDTQTELDDDNISIDSIVNDDELKNVFNNLSKKIKPVMEKMTTSIKNSFNIDPDQFIESVKYTENICMQNIQDVINSIKEYDFTKIDLQKYSQMDSTEYNKETAKILYLIHNMIITCNELEKSGYDKTRIENHKKNYIISLFMSIYIIIGCTHYLEEFSSKIDKEITELSMKNIMNSITPMLQFFGKTFTNF